MEWIDNPIPNAPQLKVSTNSSSNSLEVQIIDCNTTAKTKSFVVYAFGSDNPHDKLNPDNILQIIPAGAVLKINVPRTGENFKQIAVTCVDTCNNESELTYLK
jgi:hypothetical protein